MPMPAALCVLDDGNCEVLFEIQIVDANGKLRTEFCERDLLHVCDHAKALGHVGDHDRERYKRLEAQVLCAVGNRPSERAVPFLPRDKVGV